MTGTDGEGPRRLPPAEEHPVTRVLRSASIAALVWVLWGLAGTALLFVLMFPLLPLAGSVAGATAGVYALWLLRAMVVTLPVAASWRWPGHHRWIVAGGILIGLVDLAGAMAGLLGGTSFGTRLGWSLRASGPVDQLFGALAWLVFVVAYAAWAKRQWTIEASSDRTGDETAP